MTNQALSAILEHLCNEARNSAHATFGVMELLRNVEVDSARHASVSIGTASADQLLRSIDDVRDLLSNTPPSPAAPEEFDVAMCAGEIIEVLSIASGRRTRHMILDAPAEPLLLRQDRKAVEQVLSRVLDTAFKLAETSEVDVIVRRGTGGIGVRLDIAARDADLAHRLAMWLGADPNQELLQGSGDVPFGIAVMVAGKCLHALGGSAELKRDSAGHWSVSLCLPPQAGTSERLPSDQEPQSDALNILVAEDCDDNFALTELLLREEHLWRARDGREALRMIQKQRFDVVFMDVHMPGMDGYTAIRSIRDWETETGSARTPMVILSSDDLETQRRSAAQCGCSGFLRKPLPRCDLTNLLDRIKHARMLVA